MTILKYSIHLKPSNKARVRTQTTLCFVCAAQLKRYILRAKKQPLSLCPMTDALRPRQSHGFRGHDVRNRCPTDPRRSPLRNAWYMLIADVAPAGTHRRFTTHTCRSSVRHRSAALQRLRSFGYVRARPTNAPRLSIKCWAPVTWRNA